VQEESEVGKPCLSKKKDSKEKRLFQQSARGLFMEGEESGKKLKTRTGYENARANFWKKEEKHVGLFIHPLIALEKKKRGNYELDKNHTRTKVEQSGVPAQGLIMKPKPKRRRAKRQRVEIDQLLVLEGGRDIR